MDSSEQPQPAQPEQPQQEHAQPQAQQQQQEHAQPRQEPAGAPASDSAVSDETVVQAVRNTLQTADLNTLTEKQTRKQVEQQLGVDLSGRKDVIKKEIESWLAAQHGEDEDEGSEEDEEEEQEQEKKPKTRNTGQNKRKAASSEKEPKKKRGGGGGGFNKLCALSPALAEFLGKDKESRGQVVKGVWDYIKANGLQDPKNKRNIRCDEKMKTILKPPINMFNMNKQLSKHIYKDEGEPSSKNASEDAAEEGGSDGEEEDDEEQEKQKERPKKKAAKKEKESGDGRGNAFTKPVQLSEQLSGFLGGQQQMSRPDLTKRFWDYFKENNLQNPNDKREIICNDQLKSLFGVDKFTGFGLMKHLKPHLSAPS